MEYLIIVAFIGAVICWAWLRNRMQSGLNRAINKKKHEQGQRLTRETFTVQAPAMEASLVIDGIVKRLNIFDTVAVVTHRAYYTRISPELLQIFFGNKMLTGWSLSVRALTATDETVSIIVSPVGATEVDGVIPGARELGLVHERIKSAVKSLHQERTRGEGVS